MDGITSGAMARGGNKGKVVVVMGATATGKSKLAVDLALRFGGEVVNSDKIQVHDGLDVVTNKVTAGECRGVPHHLIGGVSPDADYAAADFCRDAARAVESVCARGRVPIIAGGSNRYLEALLDGGEPAAFRRRYECCFLWVDADLPVLDRYIRGRVEGMLEQGLVDQGRAFFQPDGDYSRGIRRAIGVPEMDAYFRREATGELDGDSELRARLLSAAVDEIKDNTCRLARRQRHKIRRLCGIPGWSLRRLDATAVLKLKTSKAKDPEADRAAWEAGVAGPAARAVATFLGGKRSDGHRDDDKAGLVVACSGHARRWWHESRVLRPAA
ncbi:Adenylate isopentenyltransferase 3, chloroplastic [Dichanthelium oligosanthes]|uniref:adenylate dimethylallyltransferase (ADP/ATP-dependent) n=1 Tax=Dichanthelium oligosanthes TaxID=888268 RepID=A0A1E5WBP0_9POAL|nr:Adenylate isopentenyltransferase 3, chloroplastic [Dichanthelium oligosanthes]